ncbi:MAG: hypothetical protein WC841_03630 [Candidatus Shapirobacteria bacterium]|jgi:hypothetical protein
MLGDKFSSLVYSGGVTLKIVFDNGDLRERVLGNSFIQKYIPGLKILTGEAADAAIHFVDKDIFFQFDSYPKIIIGARDLSEKDIISLVELALERARQERCVYCIHSAAAVFKNRVVVFWGGASGMGKTRLAQELTKQGGDFYSDEKTLIDLNTMEAMGGIAFQFLDKAYWREKRTSINSDSYYKVECNFATPLPLGLFVYGFAIDGAIESAEKWTAEKFEWHLYEELGRKIRAISRRVKNGSVSVPSLDTQKNADRRIQYVRRLTTNIPCYSIQGSDESIIKYIKKLELWK